MARHKKNDLKGFTIRKEPLSEFGPRALKLVLEGDLYLQNAHAIWTQLLREVENCPHLQIDVENVTDLDLSAIQMLVAIEKDFTARGHKMSMHFDLPYELKALLENAGMESIINKKSVKLP